ncbi:semaphorin-4G-like [Betta splendens]|uniref:Semaphorin-4G-like n=1 Tax=Betta splendens TaxID=158456 RepID=A0A6P7PD37_BETSP|nr:semaphorin-4G-like [Betta splendens]XP_029030754.1 semaphorin-4G-like [Betta splendens]
MRGAPSSALQLLLLLLSRACAAGADPLRTPLDPDVTPRITVLSSGLQGCRRFRSSALNYSTLLLEADGERLYVGARGAAFALNASDIADRSARTIVWEASPEQKRQCMLKGKDNKTECFNHIRFLQRFNSTHLYMCGTHAFKPLCAHIEEKSFVMSSQPEEGKDKCPYGPRTGYTALIIDQEMYSASRYEFRSYPDIRRNSPAPTLKTDDGPTRWLNDANFVGSTLVRQRSGAGDDDKIYFFFTERSPERATGSGHSRVPRVARVCKGDRGGHLTLQKRWTSFLKARLTCSLPEYDFQFNVLRSVHVVHADALLYGIFGLEWKNVKASAVCRFSLTDLHEAFDGPYMENQNSGWKEYTGKIPDPRPGTCITDALRARGINVSTSLPDDVLYFVRRHPLMSQEVQPSDRRPLLFRRSTHYTHLAAHTTQGLDGHTYRVLYLGTDEGWLHKAVEVGGHLLIIEELQLFDEPQPVASLVISAKQMCVYVGSASGVLQLPLSSCSRYASCYDCIFARDPHCAWNGERCVEVAAQADRSALIQDIQNGSKGCENTQNDVAQRSRSVRVGDDVLLQCELSSNLATPFWTLDCSELQGYDLTSGFRTGTDGLLIIEARRDQSGLYTCYSVENDVKVPVVTYNVTVRPAPPPAPAVPSDDFLPAPTELPNSMRPFPSPPAPLLPHSEMLSPRNMQAMYLSLITFLGGLCVVLTVVLIYVGFCLQAGRRGKYSIRAAAAAYPKRRSRSRKQQRSCSRAGPEVKTISSHCNGNGAVQDGGFLQIVPGEGHTPPAPPLPPTPPRPSAECGLSATLPSVLRRMNGNSYMLLRQADSESASPVGNSFSEELNKILEKRKHVLLLPKPDESSV